MKITSESTPPTLTNLLYVVFFASLVFAWRAVSSLSLAAILLSALVANTAARKQLFQDRKWNYLFIIALVFLVYQLTGLCYTTDVKQGWSGIRIKSGLLLIPFVVRPPLPAEKVRNNLLSLFCVLLFIASLYCVIKSFLSFSEWADPSVFFYHELVKPIHQHAVYFSVLVLIGVIFILDTVAKKGFVFNKWATWSLLTWLAVLLFLLSSKFVIAAFLLFLAYYFSLFFKKNSKRRIYLAVLASLILTATAFVFTTKNQVRDRFADIFKGDVNLAARDQYHPGIYFNGLQFRLLQWRLLPEILSENNAWLTGVGVGDAQMELNKKYISKDIYAGDGSADNTGYLAYNTHNQFLQTMLQNGLIGLTLLLVLCFCMGILVFRTQHRFAGFVFLFLITWFFTESVFETQYGIIIFTFFPLFLSNTASQARPTF